MAARRFGRLWTCRSSPRQVQRWWSVCRLAVSGPSGWPGDCEPGMGQGELVLVRVRRGHGDLDAADGAADLGADPEESEAERAAGGLGELGEGERSGERRGGKECRARWAADH